MTKPLMPPPPRELPAHVRKFADGANVMITAGPLQGERGVVVGENKGLPGKAPMPWLLRVRLHVGGAEVWCNDGYLVEAWP